LNYAKASYQSIHGRIATHWGLQDNTLTLEVTIPVNTTATVYVPTRRPTGVTESGRPAGSAPGVTEKTPDDGFAVFEVESGRYRFSADWRSPNQPIQ
jgi:alpha-L-rhamnosidase